MRTRRKPDPMLALATLFLLLFAGFILVLLWSWLGAGGRKP
ncbi:MAG: hypothetical protein ACKV2V_04555 [Blastocatellia bacterium]